MNNNILLGDSRELLKTIFDNSIDLIITSPPYKSSDNFSYTLMADIFKELYRVQKPNTLFFLNFGSLAEDKMRPFQVCRIAIDCGFQLNDTIIWVKNHHKPIQGKRRLNNLTEFIFMLYKEKMPIIDRLSIGIPYVHKSNAKRFNKGVDLHCGGNIWYINYPTIQKSDQKPHKDMFPVELPERCIKLSGLKSGIVLDCFMGSGTVGIAANKLGLDFTGIEMKRSNYEVALERLNNV